jgi:hypothetical protein
LSWSFWTLRLIFDGMTGLCTHRFDRDNDGAGIVASVGQHGFRLPTSQQRQSLGELASLPGGDPEGDRVAETVGQQMDFGAQSTSGTP